MRSRDCISVLHNLKIGTQFSDSENAQCNLEIAEIPKLRRTYIYHLLEAISVTDEHNRLHDVG